MAVLLAASTSMGACLTPQPAAPAHPSPRPTNVSRPSALDQGPSCSPSTPEVKALDSEPPCAGLPLLLIPHTLDLSCRDGFRDCSVELPMGVRNCSASPIILDQLEFTEGEGQGVLIIHPEKPTLEAGEAFRYKATWNRSGTFQVVARMRTQQGVSSAVQMQLEVRNPARNAALTACERCDGQWGSFGMLGLEGCNCRTTDAGRTCYASDECEGRCLFDVSEVVNRDSEMGRTAPACGVGEVLRVNRGKCSERSQVFGCKAVVISRTFVCQKPGMRLRAPFVCMD